MPAALKNAILSLPREDRAAFMYAYQHSPHTVKHETPPSRFEDLQSVDDHDHDHGTGDILRISAAMRLCNYWNYKWMLFYSDDSGRSGNEPKSHRRVHAAISAGTDTGGAPDPAAPQHSGQSLFLQPTRLSHLSEGARLALASGYLTILPDVTVLVPSLGHGADATIQSCPVVYFDSTKLRHHYDTTSYLQSTFYFWNMLCQERWQQQDEQDNRKQPPHLAQGAASHDDPPFDIGTSSTHYVGIIIIDPDTMLDDTVQAWVDMTLSSIPMHAHSLHVLACTTSNAATSNPLSIYDIPNSSPSAHFYAVVLPRTIKVVGKLMREKEVHIHVRSDAREFAQLLQETHGIPPSVLPMRVGGTLCELTLWRSRLVHQASIEGTSDFLPPYFDPSAALASPDPGAMPLYLDDKMDVADADEAVGKGLAVASNFSWDDDTSHAGIHHHNRQDEQDIVDSLLYFHGSEAAAPSCPARQIQFDGAPQILTAPAEEPMTYYTTTVAAESQQTRSISMEDAIQLVHAEDMVGKGDGGVLDMAALNDAMHADPKLVAAETPWDVYLSWTRHAHRPALALVSCWWRLRREWFGPKVWLKPMTQTGEGALSRKETSFLRNSECIQWLPLDTQGRSVLYLDMVEALSHASREKLDRWVVLRCIYYALHVLVSDHGRRQQRPGGSSSPASKAAVVIISPDRCPPVPFESFLETHYSVCGAMKQLWAFFPMVLDGIQLLPAPTTAIATSGPEPTQPQLRYRLSHPSYRAGVYELFGVVSMHRPGGLPPPSVVCHETADTDALTSHGLSLASLPTSVGGGFGRLQFSQWLELRVRVEWCVPAGTRNKALLDLFDFSHVQPLSDLCGDALAERKRRMNILHTRRKRDREHQEELQSRDQIAELSASNRNLRADNDRLEKLLESSRAELTRRGLEDPSVLMKPNPPPIESEPSIADAVQGSETMDVLEVVPHESSSDPSAVMTSSLAAAAAAGSASEEVLSSSASNDPHHHDNDEMMLQAAEAERTKSRNRLYSQRKRDKDRTTIETLSARVDELTAENGRLRIDQQDLEDRLRAAMWEVSQHGNDMFF